MKAIMIVYNQAHTERVEYLMEKLGIKGYTLWENVQGRGTSTGVPHLATHAWPEINKSLLMVIDDEIVDDSVDICIEENLIGNMHFENVEIECFLC